MKSLIFTSCGRRVELIQIIKDAIREFQIIGYEYNHIAPCLKIVDKKYIAPKVIDESYLNILLEIGLKENACLIVPLIDHELIKYSLAKEKFKTYGIEIMISPFSSVDIAMDKLKTFDFFSSKINVPITYLVEDYLSSTKNVINSNSLLLKPRFGSSSIGIFKLKNEKNKVKFLVEAFEIDTKNYIVQEYIDFDFEVTVDAFLYDGNLIELSQRKRLKVRAGEVEQAIIINDDEITDMIKKITDMIEFDWVINIQIMRKGNKLYLTEINPRFGGGYPLSYYAGANFIEHIKKRINKEKVLPIKNYNRTVINTVMSRYDNAFYWIEDNHDKSYRN